MATMKSSSSNSKHLKLRRQAPQATFAANPQDLDDVECGKNGYDSPSCFEYDSSDSHDKKDDDNNASSSLRSSSSAYDFLSDLSPFGRRVVRFVTPSHPSLPDRCTSECLAVAAARIIPSLAVFLALPLSIWDGYPSEWGILNLSPLIRHVDTVWSALLHTSIWPIVAATVLIAAIMPRGGIGSKHSRKGSVPPEGPTALALTVAATATRTSARTSAALSLIFSAIVMAHMTIQMGYPHAIWNPFIWGWYRVYLPDGIPGALDGACLDQDPLDSSRPPLCLSERDWDELSSGQLSSRDPDDVRTVRRGLDYLRTQSGGVIVNALARDVADAIPALRRNVEGLAPLFGDSRGKLSLVVFENDSDDGTREGFREWADGESRREEPRYAVDLVSCGPKNPDCELGLIDRYEANLFANPKASGVGKLGEFRQIVLEYILGKEEYDDYSHMIVLDVDLGTSLSPLGLLHTLGLEDGIAQEYPVASSSRQVWPGASGTIIPPYDLSAFRPRQSEANQKVRRMHQSFCELMPAGDRWRNMCEACSPMQLFMIQSSSDVADGRPYEVESAFNGLTLYPMAAIRERGGQARYDAGDDGQRCEHVGFHLSLRRPMYVNPKWSMNLKPNKPGGPTGFKAMKTLVMALVGRPNVMLIVAVGNFVFFYIAVYACWMIATGLKLIISLQNW